MKDIAEQEVIDIPDMDVEAFNEFAAEQGWSDGMPLYVPTEAKVAKDSFSQSEPSERQVTRSPNQ